MSQIKITPDLFIGNPELNRILEFLDIGDIDVNSNFAPTGGFRKNILENTVSFGLVKNNYKDISLSTEISADLAFNNGRVQSDSDRIESGVTFKCIRYEDIFGIDRDGLFLYGKAQSKVIVPSNNQWYWVRASHEYTNVEKGTFSIDTSGNLTAVGAELTKLLRAEPELPTKVRFQNAALNQFDYEVLEVIDDNTAILQGIDFQQETDLQLSVVGTFTYGISTDPQYELIYKHDSCLVELVLETVDNTAPDASTGFVKDKTFYIARVKSDGINLFIQDKRKDFWETKGSQQNILLDRRENPFVGIESIQYEHPYEPNDGNTINLAWGIRSSGWSIDTNQNKITISGDVLGGLVKSSQEISTGQLDGWRVYTSNGKYSRVTSSLKAGSAVELKVDVLDIDNYYTDGVGESAARIEQSILIVPDAEEIEFKFTANQGTSKLNDKEYAFPINTLIGRCTLVVYADPIAKYNIQYRLKSYKEYNEWAALPSDQINGYYDETSFNENGSLKSSDLVNIVPYTSSDKDPYITLHLSPNAYKRFIKKVDKGDLTGVVNVDLTEDLTLGIGTYKNYIYITGIITLEEDRQLVLESPQDSTFDGAEFTIHFNCEKLDLNGFVLNIVQSNLGISTPLRSITVGDLYMMKNVDNGIVFKLKYNGANWIISQNFDLGLPNQVIDIYNTTVSALFDSDGLGKVKGLFGYGLADGILGRPDLRQKFIVGLDPNNSDYNVAGKTGGVDKVALTAAQNAAHTHTFTRTATGIVGTKYETIHLETDSSGGRDFYTGYTVDTGTSGSGAPHENRPPYFTLIKAYKLF